MKSAALILRSVADAIGRLLFPSSPELCRIESMSPEEFLRQAARPIDGLPGITSLFDYDDPLVRRAVKALKYEGSGAVADLFAALLYDHIIEELAEERLFSNFTDPVLVPIPLSAKRRRERGWNQSEMIALRLGQKDGGRNFCVRADMLRKIKDTVSQTKFGRSERQKNLKGCFRADTSAAGRNIILIDDVATTGSTIAEASGALLAASARRVIAFTVAH